MAPAWYRAASYGKVKMMQRFNPAVTTVFLVCLFLFSATASADAGEPEKKVQTLTETVPPVSAYSHTPQRRLPVPEPDNVPASASAASSASETLVDKNRHDATREAFRQRLEKGRSNRTEGGIEEQRIYETDGRPVSQIKTPYGTYCVRHRKPGEPDHLKPPSVPGKCP